MGRKNKAYFKDLHQQAYEKLIAMQAFGESKKQAIANGTEKDKIFSFNTYKTYWKHIKYFIKYINTNHPECTTLKSAKKYINEWLGVRVEQDLSAWTIQTEAKALGKLYGIQPDDENYFKPPKRKRADIKRSRGDRIRDKHFSITNNDELIKFCRGTGLRRAELVELKGKDLISKEEIENLISKLEAMPISKRTEKDIKRLEVLLDTRLFNEPYFTIVRNGKGGRVRISPIIGKNAAQIIERIQNTKPEEKVCGQSAPQTLGGKCHAFGLSGQRCDLVPQAARCGRAHEGICRLHRRKRQPRFVCICAAGRTGHAASAAAFV